MRSFKTIVYDRNIGFGAAKMGTTASIFESILIRGLIAKSRGRATDPMLRSALMHSTFFGFISLIPLDKYVNFASEDNHLRGARSWLGSGSRHGALLSTTMQSFLAGTRRAPLESLRPFSTRSLHQDRFFGLDFQPQLLASLSPADRLHQFIYHRK